MIEIFSGVVTGIEDKNDSSIPKKAVIIDLKTFLGNVIEQDDQMSFFIHVPIDSDIAIGDIATEYLRVIKSSPDA